MVFIQGSPIELLGQVGSGQEVTLWRGRTQWMKPSNPRGGRDTRCDRSTQHPVGIPWFLSHTDACCQVAK